VPERKLHPLVLEGIMKILTACIISIGILLAICYVGRGVCDFLIKRGKPERDKKRYNKGFDYAAGRMLRQSPTEDVMQELQSQVDCARHFDDYNEFDSGVEHAMARMVKLGIAKHAT
jgi:hypothetical protein